MAIGSCTDLQKSIKTVCSITTEKCCERRQTRFFHVTELMILEAFTVTDTEMVVTRVLTTTSADDATRLAPLRQK